MLESNSYNKDIPPSKPDEPELPELPDEPLEPDEPDEPLEPDEPDEPLEPELPDEPEEPLEPDEPYPPVKLTSHFSVVLFAKYPEFEPEFVPNVGFSTVIPNCLFEVL